MTPDEFERLPSSDIEAERCCLAAMMDPRGGEQATFEAIELLHPRDFFRPAHQVIYSALVAMRAAQEPVTVPTLRAWLERHRDMQALGFDGPVYLLNLAGMPVPGVFVTAHARIVWECSVRRHMEEVGHRIVQLALQMHDDPADTITRAMRELQKLADSAVPDDNASVTTAEFCADGSRRAAPVIPGLLDHEDRVVVVAGEGSGKTTLACQVAYSLAAGVHPFTQAAIPPGRALIIDLENPHGISARRFEGLAAVASRYPGWDPGNLTIWHRPGGVNLERAQDCFRLMDVIRRAEPDLVVAGPVGKMLVEQEHSEHQHAAVTRFFDQVRGRLSPALWIEAHAPIGVTNGKRNLRPRGSGIWSSWPEFGIALARPSKTSSDLVLERFRGDREEGRLWPERLVRNLMPRPCWPVLAEYGQGTLMDPLEEQG